MSKPTPKEALERLASSAGFKVIGFIPDNMWGNEIKARMEYAKAIIPIAELHEEIVDAVFNPTSCNTDDFWEKMHRIRHKLEALK